jgi:PAS domain S-box-containing protein
METSLIAKNGSVRNVLLSSEKLLLQENNYLFTVAHDITSLKQAGQALKVNEEKYRTMLNASPDGILLINLKGIITEVSEIGLELFGADKRDDFLGTDIFLYIPSEEKNNLIGIFEKTMIEGLVQNAGLIVRKKNNALFASEASVTLIQGPEGEPVSFMVIIRDISQRKKMEAKQIHSDRMANLGEMASGIAHEINQPLNIISMVMDKILFESAKTKTIDIEFLKMKSDKIFENIIRMRNIIDHIRAFSRSHDDYVLSAFDINSSIENAVSMILEQFKYLGITLNLHLGKKIPQIVGNTYKFEQVILNLLINAKDAVIERKGKDLNYVEMVIGLKSYMDNQSVIVEITDNGIGIGNDDINNIMLPFYTTKDEGKGTGLGLSICYQIIKEMNGSIEITSQNSDGTKIMIVLNILKSKQEH